MIGGFWLFFYFPSLLVCLLSILVHKLSYKRYLTKKEYTQKKRFYSDKFLSEPLLYFAALLCLITPVGNVIALASYLLGRVYEGGDSNFPNYLDKIFEKDNDNDSLITIEEAQKEMVKEELKKEEIKKEELKRRLEIVVNKTNEECQNIDKSHFPLFGRRLKLEQLKKELTSIEKAANLLRSQQNFSVEMELPDKEKVYQIGQDK